MPTTSASSDKLTCDFCGKSQDEVGKLVAGPKVYICDECAVLAFEIVASEQGYWDVRIAYNIFKFIASIGYGLRRTFRMRKRRRD